MLARFHQQHQSLSRENNNGSEHFFSIFLIYLLISPELRQLRRCKLLPLVGTLKSGWVIFKYFMLCLVRSKRQVKIFDLVLFFCHLKFSFHWIIRITVWFIQERETGQIMADNKTILLQPVCKQFGNIYLIFFLSFLCWHFHIVWNIVHDFTIWLSIIPLFTVHK